MNGHLPHPDLEALWQDQPSEPPRISPEEFRSKMHRFERKIFWRNLREYAAGALVLIAFGYYEWRFPALLLRIGSTLTIMGTLYVMYQLHRRASSRPSPAEFGLKPCLEYHRRELERQRDALLAAWSWYLLPFVPGMIVFLAGMMAAQVKAHPGLFLPTLIGYGVLAAIGAAVFFVVWKLNQWTAKKLQTRIDELNTLTSESDQ
jgi:hypothetical protein